MIKKLALITGASFLNKIFFILLPYLIDPNSYYNFNNNYFTASFVSMLVLSGFDFVYARFSIDLKQLSLILIVNSIIFILLIQLIDHSIDLWIILLIVYNIFNSLISTFLLFENKIKHYFLISFFSFILSLLAIVLHQVIGLKLFIAFVLLNFALIIYLIRFKKGKRYEIIGPFDFYKIGFSIFIINSVAGLYFALNKYIVNNYFEIQIANSFTFAWMTLVPMLYIGNSFEKLIYSSANMKINRKRFLMISFFNSFSVLLYIIFVYFIFTFFNILPQSVTANYYFKLFIPISTGLFIFSSIHFPLNGVLFKFNSKIAQERTALFNIPTVLISSISIFYLASINKLSISILIFISFLSLIIINLLKGYFVFDEIKKEHSR